MSESRRVRSPVSIICCPDGPFLVRGATSITDELGQEHATTRPVVAVCRCGKSARKPWCDGTHKVVTAKSDGSRFSATGAVLEGPAVTSLSSAGDDGG